MFKNIVIPIDLSDKYSSKSLLPLALKAIAPFDARLHLVYIIPDFGTKIIEDYLPKYWMKEQKSNYEEKFRYLIKQHVPEGMSIDFYIGRGAIYDEVIQYSSEVKADLIVISAVRPQLRDYMLGPNASKIVRHAGISVLVIRD